MSKSAEIAHNAISLLNFGEKAPSKILNTRSYELKSTMPRTKPY